MKNIVTLVDFTPTAMISAKQSVALGKLHGAKVIFCHILESYYGDITQETQDQMLPYQSLCKQEGVEHSVIFGKGELIGEVHNIVLDISPDLVIVGTHGKVGIKQALFGATIFKMVNQINCATLVVNDNMKIREEGFKRVLLPIAPHDDYLLKVKQTCSVLEQGGIISIFVINKPGIELSPNILENISDTKRLLDKLNIRWEYLEVEATDFSVGYSKQTIQFASENNMEVISIMTDVSEQNLHFGGVDKENLLLNKAGVPILCSKN